MKLRKTDKTRAQGMVEFALAIPLILLMVMAIIEFGRLLFIYTEVSAAGREAARYGAGIGPDPSDTMALYNDCDGIRAAAMRIGLFAGVQADDVSIFHDTGPGTTAVAYCQLGVNDPIPAINLGDRILVEVETEFNPIVPIFQVPPMTLHSESAHTLIKEAPVIAYTPQVVSVGETCDNTQYDISMQDPLGPVVTVTLTNSSADNLTIDNLLVVWDPTSSPVLNQITDGSGTVLYNPYASAPSYTKNVGWAFNGGSSITFKLVYSKVIKNNVIVRLALDNDCSFGQ